MSESSLYFDPSDGGSAGGVGVLGVQVECETDGAVAPLRGLFPEVTFEGRASEVVRLSSPLGASGLPTLTVDDATAREDAAFVTFEAWLHQAQPKDVSVSWWVESQDGQAMGGVDYALVSGVVTVPAGSRTAQVRVPIIDDDLDEPDETFLLVLGSPAGVSLDRLAALGTITDDDPPVGISVTGATADEGGPGTPGEVEFEVRLDHPEPGHDDLSGQVVSFDYETVDGTANAGGDYEAARGSARIMPGDSEFKLTVRLVGDDVHEAHEFFSLRLYNVMHAVPSDRLGAGLRPRRRRARAVDHRRLRHRGRRAAGVPGGPDGAAAPPGAGDRLLRDRERPRDGQGGHGVPGDGGRRGPGRLRRGVAGRRDLPGGRAVGDGRDGGDLRRRHRRGPRRDVRPGTGRRLGREVAEQRVRRRRRRLRHGHDSWTAARTR